MRIAVVGSGISGLGSAWILSQEHEVHLFEADGRLGGHAHTVTVKEPHNEIPIDTGFLVYNELTYPHLTAFFKALQVETVDSDMSLSVQAKDQDIEWNGTNLNTVYGQRRNLLRPKFHKMLLEIVRFHKDAEENLSRSRRHGWTLRELLAQKNHSLDFTQNYLIPIGAAIWSTPENQMFEFPAETFLTFFINHKLLQVNDRPVWRTVRNGSVQYVQKVAQKIPHIHLNSPVKLVERKNGQVFVTVGGQTLSFDRVVMATHAGITAKILKFANDQEQRVISAVKDQSNRTILHKDASVMPKTKRCWASWNVLGASGKAAPMGVSLSYYLNRLQPLKTKSDYFVTLNPKTEPKDILREFDYAHPVFDRLAVAAQKELPGLQGHGGVFFAGAWSRYGFHEDGLLSAVKVGEAMGIATPWRIA